MRRFTFALVFAVSSLTLLANTVVGQSNERPRARDIGVRIGTYDTGEHNAITDVLTRQESFRANELNRQVSRHFMGRAQ